MQGSHYCKCKGGMEPVLDCRPTTALGLADRGLPTEAIHVSGTEPGYNKVLLLIALLFSAPTGAKGVLNLYQFGSDSL